MCRRIWIAGIAAALPLCANAQQGQPDAGFDYTFVDVAYVDTETGVGPFNIDGDGLALRGAYSLNDRLYLVGDYSALDHDGGIDTSLLSLGVGMHHPLQSNLDLIGELTWVRAEVDTPLGSADDDGLGLAVGLRFRAADNVELEGTINHINLDDSNTTLALRGRYYLNPTFALAGGLLIDSGDLGWSVGIRAGFGR